MLAIRTVAAAAAMTIFFAAAASGGDPFVGTFRNAELLVVIRGGGGSYTGTAEFGGGSFPIDARAAGSGTIAGQYVYQGTEIPFRAALSGDGLIIESEGERYALVRAEDAEAGGAPPVPAGTVKNDDWGMLFTPPPGWTARLTEAGYLLGSEGEAGLMLLLPQEASGLDEIRAEARKGLHEEGGTDLAPAGELRPFGESGLAGVFDGTLGGERAKAYAVALLSPYGAGATVLVAVSPEKFGAAHREAAERLARGIEFYRSPLSPAAREWKEKLAGCRLSYFSRYSSSGGGGYTSETTIDLCGEGYFRYSMEDETVWNVDPGTVTGGYSMQHGKGSGTWKVISRGGEAVLVLDHYSGDVDEYTLSSNDEGRTFLNGDRYLRTCDPNDQVVEARPNCR